jgi:hypothetical protein
MGPGDSGGATLANMRGIGYGFAGNRLGSSAASQARGKPAGDQKKWVATGYPFISTNQTSIMEKITLAKS